MAGPLAAAIVSALEGAVVVGGLSALGAGLLVTRVQDVCIMGLWTVINGTSRSVVAFPDMGGGKCT